MHLGHTPLARLARKMITPPVSCRGSLQLGRTVAGDPLASASESTLRLSAAGFERHTVRDGSVGRESVRAVGRVAYVGLATARVQCVLRPVAL